MSEDKYAEVIIVIVTCTLLFFVLGTVLFFFVLYYQKKKFQHAKEKNDMQATFEQNLLQSRLEMQEQTFNNISQEIHDNVGQLLSLAKVQLSIAEQSETANKELIAEIKNNISNALTDLRDIAKSLSNERLHQLTLTQAIEQELQRLSRSKLFEVHCNIIGEEKPVSDNCKIILFRILQEIFQNILKHAEATEIVAEIAFSETQLTIDISDNGKGFDVEEKSIAAEGLGLQNIMSRTALIGGTAFITGEPQHGAQISLNIPYE